MPTFEDLIIWKEAIGLMKEIVEICKKFPREEKFRLKDQVERSSSSVCDNIAEGYTSYYYNDKIKGMYTARKEAGETQNHIRKMQVYNYINKNIAEDLVKRYQKIIRGINGYVRYIAEKRDSEKSKKQIDRKVSFNNVPSHPISQSPGPIAQIAKFPIEANENV